MKELEFLDREGRTREFHKMIRDITHIGKRSTIVQELIVDDNLISNRNDISAYMVEYFTKIHKVHNKEGQREAAGT